MAKNNYITQAKKYGTPYEEGLTRRVVLERDGWVCQMETRLYPSRAIDPTVPKYDEDGLIPDARGSVDHIVPLAEPGSPGHVSSNVRAAHRLCNREAASPSKLLR
jgi:hypothetical protein